MNNYRRRLEARREETVLHIRRHLFFSLDTSNTALLQRILDIVQEWCGKSSSKAVISVEEFRKRLERRGA